MSNANAILLPDAQRISHFGGSWRHRGINIKPVPSSRMVSHAHVNSADPQF